MQKLHVSLFQIPLVWEKPQANRDYITQKIESLSHKTNLIVLPEMFTTGFTMHAASVAENHLDTTTLWMQTMAQKHQCALTGSIIVKEKIGFLIAYILLRPTAKYIFTTKDTFFRMPEKTKLLRRVTKN